MPKRARKAVTEDKVLTKQALARFLRSQGRSASATEGEPLRDFARWLINSNIKRFSNRVRVKNAEIIALLSEINNPGPPREVVKTWLATRLFDRVTPDANSTLRFMAQPKDAAELAAAKALMAADEAATGTHANRALLEAIELFGQGQVRAAYDKYDQMRLALKAGEYTGHHTQGVMSVRPFAEFAQAIDKAPDASGPRGPIEFQQDRHFAEKRPIAVIGVDPVYHDRYAERMVHSVNGAFNVHFHVCNPAEVKLISAPNVRYSFETYPAATSPYYATMRFLVLRQVLQAYDAPVITLDADSVSDGQVPELFGLLENYDIALNTSKDARGVLPWRFILAAAMGANPTPAAHEFLRSFEAQFDHILTQDGTLSWYVDQALLASTLFLTQERQPATRLLVGGLLKTSGTKQSKV
jgi:hypothetical protein